MTKYYTFLESPIGPLLLTSDGTSLSRLFLNSGRHAAAETTSWTRDDTAEPFAEAKRQLTDYFAGSLRGDFALPLAPDSTTPFQRLVWAELIKIPYGQTITYGELARRVGDPKASRAVGLANGKNPISIIVPCHRVIGSNGKLTGYAGGLANKSALLTFESEMLRHGNSLGIAPVFGAETRADRASEINLFNCAFPS